MNPDPLYVEEPWVSVLEVQPQRFSAFLIGCIFGALAGLLAGVVVGRSV